MPQPQLPKPIRIKVPAVLELNTEGFAGIAKADWEELRGIMFELLESRTQVSLDRGDYTVRGTVSFIVPSPQQLKKAWDEASAKA